MTEASTLPITFEPFPKIYRLSRPCIITEKLDGTNAQVIVTEDGQVAAASRTRLITPESDNMGFARWVLEHADELRQLGPGRHFGEWWGSKIQRGYGLKEKRFSLFNTSRWTERDRCGVPLAEGQQEAPACCSVVPVLYEGLFHSYAVETAVEHLRLKGSQAAPGFMRPEGIVIFHTPGGYLFKKTIEGDEAPKGQPR